MIIYRCLLYFAFSLVFISIRAQITHRNLLQKNCSSSCIAQMLLGQSSFRPFAQSTEAWRNVLPDTILQQLVRNGENALTGDFPNIPASVTLDFVRNANRTRYETISFGKRNRLWSLVLAESIEGKKDSRMRLSMGSGPFVRKASGGQAHIYLFKNQEADCRMSNTRSLIYLPPKRQPILRWQIILWVANLTASHHLFDDASTMRLIAEYLFPCNQLSTIGWAKETPMRN